MYYIDPHIHMVSRVTDDYEMLAKMGCVAVSEPAFWAGFDRGSVDGFRDYFRQLTEFEPKRAGWYRLQHYTWLCINAKEAENVSLSREVIKMIPEFLDKPGVLGIGEIGLNKNSRNELEVFETHVELAVRHRQLILIHTPHLEDKRKGTKLIIRALQNNPGVKPHRVLIDHCEEHTIRLVRDAGFWAGLTLYPRTKCTPQRAADIIEMHGPERLWLNSAADWGESDPLAVPKALCELARRGHPERLRQRLGWDNPVAFLSQCPKFRLA
jgi:hypothetical protein